MHDISSSEEDLQKQVREPAAYTNEKKEKTPPRGKQNDEGFNFHHRTDPAVRLKNI